MPILDSNKLEIVVQGLKILAQCEGFSSGVAKVPANLK